MAAWCSMGFTKKISRAVRRHMRSSFGAAQVIDRGFGEIIRSSTFGVNLDFFTDTVELRVAYPMQSESVAVRSVGDAIRWLSAKIAAHVKDTRSHDHIAMEYLWSEVEKARPIAGVVLHRRPSGHSFDIVADIAANGSIVVIPVANVAQIKPSYYVRNKHGYKHLNNADLFAMLVDFRRECWWQSNTPRSTPIEETLSKFGAAPTRFGAFGTAPAFDAKSRPTVYRDKYAAVALTVADE